MATATADKTLIVIALKSESQNLFEQHGVTPFYCGLGQVKAAYNLTHLLTKTPADKMPSCIVNLGTAGSFHLKQEALVEVKSFVQRNHFLPLNKNKIDLITVTDLPKVVCGTGDTIEKQNTKSVLKYDVMDMEGYALAYVCKQFQIPFISLKFISDNSDENTVNHWKANLKQAAEKLYLAYQKISL